MHWAFKNVYEACLTDRSPNARAVKFWSLGLLECERYNANNCDEEIISFRDSNSKFYS